MAEAVVELVVLLVADLHHAVFHAECIPSCRDHLSSYSPISSVPERRRSKAVAENTQGFFFVSSRLSSGAVLNVRLGRPHCRREDDRCPKVIATETPQTQSGKRKEAF